MTTISSNAPASTPTPASSFSLSALVAALFQVNLREKLDRDTAGDKSDAAYTWGM